MKILKKRNHDKKLNLKKKVIIIAEIGLNHNGSFSLAKKSMLSAFKAGADLVKFQNFKTEDFLKNKNIKWNDGIRKKSLFDICKKNEFKDEWLDKLIKIAKKKGKNIFSTPTSVSMTDNLIRRKISIVKNGSDYLTNLPLINYFSKKFKTIILSTGMADEVQISNALNEIKKGKSSVILLHCTSVYPTPNSIASLNRITSLKNKFNLDVGFSDHTKGWLAATLSVAKGARVIEKHFTLSKKMKGPDHWFSLNPNEFKNYVKKIRIAEEMQGKKTIEPAKIELKNRHSMQVSMVFNKNLNRNNKIKYSHFDILKSKDKSLTYYELKKIIGKKLNTNKKIGDVINFKDVK
jgi:N,N'-diacetyllegionaminate synthase